MIAATADVVKIDNDLFNQFLEINRDKIDSIIPQNPVITRTVEWRYEDFWEQDKGDIN